MSVGVSNNRTSQQRPKTGLDTGGHTVTGRPQTVQGGRIPRNTSATSRNNLQYPWHINRPSTANSLSRNTRTFSTSKAKDSVGEDSKGHWGSVVWKVADVDEDEDRNTDSAKSPTPSRGSRDLLLQDPQGMSVSELPPINRRPSSAHSRKSSGNTSVKDIPKGTVLKYEKPVLISLEGPSMDEEGRPFKRSHKSPGSESSNCSFRANSSPRSTSNTASDNRHCKYNPSRSWCSNDPPIQGQYSNGGTLETLFEKNYSSKLQTNGGSSTPRLPKTSIPKSESQDKLTQNMRTKSFTNLSKLSDSTRNLSGSVDEKKEVIHKISSEQNLNGIVNNGGIPLTAKSATCRKRIPNHTKHSTQVATQNVSPPYKPLKQSKSTPNIRASTGPVHSENLKNQNSTQDVESDCEKDRRIREWLMGVESSDPDRPETPIINEEEPVQTDTAIHIVYNGDA